MVATSASETGARGALLFGRDDTPGIVSVQADRSGRARVWRRVEGQVRCEEDTYPGWLFLARPELLKGLPVLELDRSILASALKLDPGTVGLVRLDGTNTYSYLVLTDRLDEVERTVLETARGAQEEGRLSEPLSGLLYVRPAVEQYLTIKGRTYFKGLTYGEIRRLQFDLETTSLDSASGSIFMVAIKDSDGFAAVLDTATMSEAELIAEFVQIVRERDPDVIENHNIFDFDIRFLMGRARTLDVPLPLGRDGSTFSESRDSVKIGPNSESFTRYGLAGREIIDTLHATRRYGAIQRDLRGNGLKETARYFGVARPQRVYIDGAHIWPTFQSDPDRVRAYCFDDVDEVDRLSPLLMAPSFAVASMVPKTYERIATAGTGQGLIEPLLVRAYVAGGHSLPSGKSVSTFPGGRTGVFVTGIVDHVVKADVASLYPSIMLADRIAPGTDHADAFLGLLQELTERRLGHKAEARRADALDEERRFHDTMQAAMKVLINSFYGMLGASFALFCDKGAAERVTARGREILQLVLDELQAREAIPIEADTDGVLFSMPHRTDGGAWTFGEELALIEQVAAALPAGVRLEHDGRYRAMYSYMEKNYALLDYPAEASPGAQPRDGLRLVGAAFRSSRTEPFIERFLSQALREMLEGRVGRVQDLFRTACNDLRTMRVPARDLCVTMPLTKDPQKYAGGERKEEPYEVWLAAGNTAWRAGARIQYYQARAGKRLIEAGSADYDADYYVNRLRAICVQRLEKAFSLDDLATIFSESPGLFDPPVDTIRPRLVQLAASLGGEGEDETGDEENGAAG